MENISYNKIKEDLENLGIKKGDDVLVHSSFKSLGYVEGGIQTLIEAIISQLGDRGTLLFPTLSYRFVNPMEIPTFDIRNTPVCVGAIPEFFRTYDGVKRSMNPTHSVSAYGFRRDEYIKDHYKDNEPVGENSPFYLLSKFGGKVLMLGCSIKSNTSMHGVEEMAKVPYVLSDEPREYTLIDEDGNITKKDYYYHCMGQKGYSQRYDRLENLMEYKKGKVLEAECNVIDSAKMWEAGLKKIKEDTYYFTDKTEAE